MPRSAPPGFISLAGAAQLSGLSLRTWQRRVEDGQAPRAGDGGRSAVALAALDLPWLADWDAHAIDALLRADQGDARAQAEVGARFALAALRPARRGGADDARLAGYFLAKAAEQRDADAMHWLALLAAAGLGDAPADAQTLLWLARAAAHGHAIAHAQVRGLWQSVAAPGATDTEAPSA